MSFWETFKVDFKQNTLKEFTVLYGLFRIILSPRIRFLLYCRAAKKNRLFCIFRQLMSLRYGLEFDTNRIGKGLYVGHPYGITINQQAELGDYCHVHKGVTIGSEARGKRAGTPKIGNKVWFGVNSTCVGKITIGNNVLIAPNTFVNCDIPDNSIVIGNPCKIIPSQTATDSYITIR